MVALSQRDLARDRQHKQVIDREPVAIGLIQLDFLSWAAN